jgi:hypothetical protein
VIVIALAALVLVVRPTTTETEVILPASLPDPSEESPDAVVIGLRQSGGFSVFGITFGDVTHTAMLQFYIPAGCHDLVTIGEPLPPPFTECAGPGGIEGTVSGGGITAGGESIVTVEIIVTEDCYRSIVPGDRWPPVGSACA